MPKSTAPSTLEPERLPEPTRLQQLCRALALLDEIFEPEWSLRYFSYDTKWGAGGHLATIRTGEGEGCAVWFSPKGTVIAGADPASRAAKIAPAERIEHMYSKLPRPLSAARIEFDEATFALWRLPSDKSWHTHPLARGSDGSAGLLWILDDEPDTYVRHARDYFDRKIARGDVAAVYAGTIDAAIVARLNEDANVRRVLTSAKKLGFEIGSAKPTAAKEKKTAKAAVPAAVRKQLEVLFDPAFLAKRLTTFALIDAIVAPTKRFITIDKTTPAMIGAMGPLNFWLAGSAGVLWGGKGATSDEGVPDAIAKRWKTSSRDTGAIGFLAWTSGRSWKLESFDDAAAKGLAILQRNYLAWAKKHYGHALPPDVITSLWNGRPLTRDDVERLNPRADFATIAREASHLKWKVSKH